MTRKAEIDPVIAEYEKLCAYNPEQGEGFLKGVLAVAEGRVAFDALRGRWITAYPNGKDHEGRPLFIGPDDRVLAGLGKNNGKKLDDIPRPKPSEPLAWRGSSQRRKSKEDYEEKEYWVNEQRQKSEKALKREQKRAQKLERQSEPIAQAPQKSSLSPEQKRAEAVRQRFLNTSLPDHFESSEQAVDYFNKVAPNVDAADLKLMPPQCAHDVALAASKLGADFPHAFDKGFAFMLPDAEEGRINAAKAKLDAEVDAGKFKAEAAAKFDKLLSANEFMQSSLYEAIKFANLNDEQFRAKALQLLWGMASNYGFDYKTATISQLVKSGAGAELKNIWCDIVSSYRAAAQKEDLDKRQTELERLRGLGEDKAFAQWDKEQAQLSILSPLFVAQPNDGNLAKLSALYRKSLKICPSKGFHPPLKDSVPPLTAVIIHELVHCIDMLPEEEPISFSTQIVQLFHKERKQYLALLSESDSLYVSAAFSAYDRGITQCGPKAPYALYSYQEFVAECITECLTAPKPTKTAQSTFKIFKQIYDMRVKT